MKPLLAIGLFAAILYGAIRLGKYLGDKRKPKDWEPSNSKQDQSKNMFV